ncbi:MAG: outer membrane protein transport protein [Gemmataceae bacterium]|nr:outer membrane protein transport protein [Gemmataceae bacterium]MCI0737892.1 outer membrane protein transport protein [Gemmataceae bacterium]
MLRFHRSALLGAALVFMSSAAAQAQGIILPGSGGAHRSMGGVSTAIAVDAVGGNYWNPAAIATLPFNEVVIGGEFSYPEIHLGSTIPGFSSGSTRSDSGLGVLTGVGYVHHNVDKGLTTGLGLWTIGGGGVNYPGDPSNPVLSPTGPFQRFVLGPQAASLQLVQIAPSAAFRVTDKLAIGFGPTVDVAVVSMDPAFFGPPDDANGDGVLTFPTGTHTRPFWGGGFRAGLVYEVAPALSVGFSYTSQQWFEKWRFNARDEVGNPTSFAIDFSLPQFFSAGVAYRGIDGLILAADVRYIDYENSDLLGDTAKWQNIFALAVGAQYQLTRCLTLRAGYIFNENPIPNTATLLNSQLPGFIQHTASVGAMMQLNESMALSVGYVHAFKNEISGSIVERLGTSTSMDMAVQSLVFGLHVRFGCCGPRHQDVACHAEHREMVIR